MNCILLLFYSFVNYKCRDYNNSNNVDSMKWIQRKHLAGYILAYCIVLVSSLTLLAGFAVQSLLAKFLCQLVSMEEGISWECNCAWYQPYAKIWVDKAEGTTNVFFLASSCCSYRPSFEHVQSHNNVHRKVARLS